MFLCRSLCGIEAGDRHNIKGVYYGALYLTLKNLAVQKSSVKNKATVDAHRVCISDIPTLLPHVHVAGTVAFYLYISAWASTLLVQTDGQC